MSPSRSGTFRDTAGKQPIEQCLTGRPFFRAEFTCVGFPLSDAAHALFSAVHGIVLLSLDAKLGPFEPATCERQIRFVVEHVVQGLTS